jgi:hypothetical protein
VCVCVCVYVCLPVDLQRASKSCTWNSNAFYLRKMQGATLSPLSILTSSHPLPGGSYLKNCFYLAGIIKAKVFPPLVTSPGAQSE